MTTIPRKASDFTARWLNEVLEAEGHPPEHRARAVFSSDSDIPGQTAEIARLRIVYHDDSTPLPTRMIAKYTTRNGAMLDAVIRVYDQYRRETAFYTELTEPGMAVPRCIHANHIPGSEQFVLLMEDLAPAESPSWASTPEQVAIAVSHLPAFHARWWNEPLLREKDWLVQFDNEPFYTAAAGAACASFPKMQEHFGDSVETTRSIIQHWHNHLPRMLAHIETRPFTLVHGDYHPKQMFFPTDAGGSFAVIDWQFPFVAQGAWDLIRIMALGQDVAARRENQDALLRTYHEGLLAAGVTDYSMEDLQDDIRIGLVVNQFIMAVALADTDISLIERECATLGLDWKEVLLGRGDVAAQDWNVLAYLESL